MKSTNNGTKGGLLIGDSHNQPSGGMPATVMNDGGRNILLEGGEVIITAPAVEDPTLHEFDGEMKTGKEIFSSLNIKGGGVPILKKGGSVNQKNQNDMKQNIKSNLSGIANAISQTIPYIKSISNYYQVNINGDVFGLQDIKNQQEAINDYRVFLNDKEFLQKYYTTITGYNFTENFEDDDFDEQFNSANFPFSITDIYHIRFNDFSSIIIEFDLEGQEIETEADKGLAMAFLPIYKSTNWDIEINELQKHFENKNTDIKASGGSVRYSPNRKSPSHSATWHEEDFLMVGNDGNLWQVKTASNNVKRWVKVKEFGEGGNITFEEYDNLLRKYNMLTSKYEDETDEKIKSELTKEIEETESKIHRFERNYKQGGKIKTIAKAVAYKLAPPLAAADLAAKSINSKKLAKGENVKDKAVIKDDGIWTKEASDLWHSKYKQRFKDIFAKGGEVNSKKYYIQYGIGKAKYLVSYHDGVKTHKDGSKFYDIKIFRNKKDLEEFEQNLLKDNYVYTYAKGGQPKEFDKKQWNYQIESSESLIRRANSFLEKEIDNSESALREQQEIRDLVAQHQAKILHLKDNFGGEKEYEKWKKEWDESDELAFKKGGTIKLGKKTIHTLQPMLAPNGKIYNIILYSKNTDRKKQYNVICLFNNEFEFGGVAVASYEYTIDQIYDNFGAEIADKIRHNIGEKIDNGERAIYFALNTFEKGGQIVKGGEIQQYHIDDMVEAMESGAKRLEFLFDEFDEHKFIFEKLNNPTYYRITEYEKIDGNLEKIESYDSPNLQDVIYSFKQSVKPKRFEKGGQIKVGKHSLVYSIWSKMMDGNGISGTIRTTPQNYYVAKITEDGNILFDNPDSMVSDIDRDKVKKLWEKNEIPKEKLYGYDQRLKDFPNYAKGGQVNEKFFKSKESEKLYEKFKAIDRKTESGLDDYYEFIDELVKKGLIDKSLRENILKITNDFDSVDSWFKYNIEKYKTENFKKGGNMKNIDKRLIFNIEDTKLPDKVAEIWFNYPNLKVLNNDKDYVFGYMFIPYNNELYLVHDSDGDISMFVNDIIEKHKTENFKNGGSINQNYTKIPTYKGKTDDLNVPINKSQMNAWVDENVDKVPDEPYFTDGMKRKHLRGLYYEHNKLAAYGMDFFDEMKQGGQAGDYGTPYQIKYTKNGETDYITLRGDSKTDVETRFKNEIGNFKIESVGALYKQGGRIKRTKVAKTGDRVQWWSDFTNEFETGVVKKYLGFFGKKGHTYTVVADKNGEQYDVGERGWEDNQKRRITVVTKKTKGGTILTNRQHIEKLISAVKKGTLKLPEYGGDKAWRGYKLTVQNLTWARNYYDGYNVYVYNPNHIGTFKIDYNLKNPEIDFVYGEEQYAEGGLIISPTNYIMAKIKNNDDVFTADELLINGFEKFKINDFEYQVGKYKIECPNVITGQYYLI